MHADLESLRRLQAEVRRLRVCVVALGALLGAAVLVAAARQTTFAELNAERINIVDAAGKPRLVIANAERFPSIVLNGKTYQRSVNPAGLVFFDTGGSEVGGLAVTDLKPGRVLALAFDNANFDAIGLQNRISPDGKDANAGLVINSRPDGGLTATDAGNAARRRLVVENNNETAQVVLSDPQGRPRLQLRVETTGEPILEMLDEQGKPTYRITQRGATP
jgi:hypothetical protein